MMFLSVKVGACLACKYQVMRKRLLPVVGDQFTIRGIGDLDWADQRVRCTGIVNRNPGGKLYLVETV